MKRSEWLEVLALINARWPEHAAGRSLAWAEAWWPDVEPFSQETLYAAVRAYGVEDSRGFPPDGGQLVRRAAELEGGGLDFDEVWREILEAIRRWGSIRSPEWSSPQVAALVRGMGWRSICTMEETQVATVRAQARMMWESIRKRQVREMLGIERAPQQPVLGPGGMELEPPDLSIERGDT